MEKFILQNMNIKITKEEAVRQLRMENAEKEDLSRLSEMVDEAQRAANPKALYAVAPIESRSETTVTINGVTINCPLMAKNLKNTNRVFPYVVTCGLEAEAWSKTAGDFMEEYWADGIKLLLLSKAMLALKKQVKQAYAPESRLSAMNPGSIKQWPLAQQRVLFQILETVTDDIGVTLTDSCLMLPSKSGSGIFFAGSEQYENCSLCPILNCPNRRAPYAGSGEEDKT